MLVEMSVEVVSNWMGACTSALELARSMGDCIAPDAHLPPHAAVSKYRSGVPAETTPKETASTKQANMFNLCLAYNGSQDENVKDTTKLDVMLFEM